MTTAKFSLAFVPTRHNLDQVAIETVGFLGPIGAEDFRDESGDQEGHGGSFWDASDIFHIYYLQEAIAINGKHYSNVLDQFNVIVRKK